jgi:hypothetical protein
MLCKGLTTDQPDNQKETRLMSPYIDRSDKLVKRFTHRFKDTTGLPIVDLYKVIEAKLAADGYKTAFLALPHHKQQAVSQVGLGGRSYAELSRELRANPHKYPDISRSDLAIAWSHNRGEPAPSGEAAERGGLLDYLHEQNYVRAGFVSFEA